MVPRVGVGANYFRWEQLEYLRVPEAFRRARYWASIYWQYTGPGGTCLLAEGGARIPGYWKFAYVPLKRLVTQRKLIETCA